MPTLNHAEASCHLKMTWQERFRLRIEFYISHFFRLQGASIFVLSLRAVAAILVLFDSVFWANSMTIIYTAHGSDRQWVERFDVRVFLHRSFARPSPIFEIQNSFICSLQCTAAWVRPDSCSGFSLFDQNYNWSSSLASQVYSIIGFDVLSSIYIRLYP